MDLEPRDVTTLDPGDTRVITWSRIRDLMTAPSPPDAPGGYFPSYLSTVRPNGRPHTTGIAAPTVIPSAVSRLGRPSTASICSFPPSTSRPGVVG